MQIDCVQAAIRDISDAENTIDDLQGQNKIKKLFEEFGLDYSKLKQQEKRRWRADKLRDLVIKYEQVKVVNCVGVGGTARVYEARSVSWAASLAATSYSSPSKMLHACVITSIECNNSVYIELGKKRELSLLATSPPIV
jgi:hypothetical protein